MVTGWNNAKVSASRKSFYLDTARFFASCGLDVPAPRAVCGFNQGHWRAVVAAWAAVALVLGFLNFVVWNSLGVVGCHLTLYVSVAVLVLFVTLRIASERRRREFRDLLREGSAEVATVTEVVGVGRVTLDLKLETPGYPLLMTQDSSSDGWLKVGDRVPVVVSADRTKFRLVPSRFPWKCEGR
jgi:hypothetical protein